MVEKIGGYVDGGTKLSGGGKYAGALGSIGLKTTKDIALGDAVYTGLCDISGMCETIALGCSTIKVIPYKGQIYLYAKIISKGCMSYRNLCAGDGC